MPLHTNRSLAGKGLLITALLVAAVILAYLVFLATYPSSVPKTTCQDRNAEELEMSVAGYFSRLADESESFKKNHKFERDRNAYTESSRAWLVPFTMVDVKTDQQRHYFAMVNCDGRVELSIEK